MAVSLAVMLGILVLEAGSGVPWAHPIAVAMLPVLVLCVLLGWPLLAWEERIERDKREEKRIEDIHEMQAEMYAQHWRIANIDRLPPTERAMELYGSYMKLLTDVHMLRFADEASRGKGARPFDLYALERSLGDPEPGEARRVLSRLAEAGLIDWGGRAWSPVSITEFGPTATREYFANKAIFPEKEPFPLSSAHNLERLRNVWADEIPVAAIFGELPKEYQDLIRWLLKQSGGTVNYRLRRVFEDANGRELDYLWTDKMQALGILEEITPGRLARVFGDGGPLPRVRVSEALAEVLGQRTAARSRG